MIVGAASTGGTAVMSTGRAAALLFAKEGARVFAVDYDAAALKETHDAVVAAGGTAGSAVADVRDAQAMARAVAQCYEQFGALHVVHNNVGVGSTGGVTSISEEEWSRVVDINLSGIRNSCRAALPVMEKCGGGSIINVSSLLSVRGLRKIHNVAYAVSKAGVEALTRVIALEYADRNIRANNLILGLIDTPAVRGAYERRRALPGNAEEADRIWTQRSKFAPLGRMGTPLEVANAALFLASDESSYITGTDIWIDGGISLVHLG